MEGDAELVAALGESLWPQLAEAYIQACLSPLLPTPDCAEAEVCRGGCTWVVLLGDTTRPANVMTSGSLGHTCCLLMHCGMPASLVDSQSDVLGIL